MVGWVVFNQTKEHTLGKAVYTMLRALGGVCKPEGCVDYSPSKTNLPEAEMQV